MAATTFTVTSKGKTAQEAFEEAVEQARYRDGNGGYSGTIAEKSSFRMVAGVEGLVKLSEADKRQLADSMLDDRRSWIDDKWAPAGCIALGNEQWLFFGWANC